MKPNWIGNDALQRYAESHPPKSRIILETVTTTSSDIKDTKADWDGADSIAGWTTLPEGGATPTGTSSNRVSYQPADDEDVITSLPGITGATVAAPIVAWDTGPDDAQAGIKSVTARLDPDANLTGKEVTTWTCQLFRIKEVRTGTLEGETWDLEAISINKAVTAPSSISDVEFAFPGISPAIGDPPSFADEQSRLESLIPERIPHTVIVIGAYKGDGTVASNVAWLGDADTDTTTSNGHRLRHYSMAQIDKQFENQTVARVEVAAAATGLPRFQIKANSFTQQTITFTTNQIDLTTTPTGSVEVVVEHEQPGGASGQAQARNNGSTSWIAVSDGDLVEDVAGLSSTGPLYDMRYIATPSTSGWTVPTVRRLGMREIARETVDGIARIGDTRYQMDPRTLKASIPTLQVELTRDGVQDYRDFATELFSDNHAGDLEFRVMYGHPDLARSNWLHLDNFRLHDYDTAGESVVIEAIHPLALTKRVIPTGSTSGQNAVVFAGTTDTAETVYGDILDTVGLQARYRGVELIKSSTSFTLPKIGKTLSKPRPAKEELDRVAFIEGVSVVPSGGRLKARRIWTSTGGPYNSPVSHFDHIIPISVSPNLDQRVVDYRVPYSYSATLDNGRGGFLNAIYQNSTSAISKLGHTSLTGTQELDEETARWLSGSTYASFIAKRTVAAFKQGAIVIRFRSMDPRPWLEIGDVVEVSTDRFIGRGLETDRALRGRLSVIGPIVEHDIQGTEFSVWVPEIESAIPASSDIELVYADPEIILGTPFVESGGTQSNDEEDMVYHIGVPLRPNYDCRSVQITWSQKSPSSSTATTPSLQGHGYWYNISGLSKDELHILKASTATSLLKTSTAAAHDWLVQPNGGTPLSDTEDDEFIVGGVNAGRVLVTVTPYAETVPVGSTVRPTISGTIQQFKAPKLKSHHTGGTYTDGTNTYQGHRLNVGSGLTLTQTTDGYPLIKLST